MAEHYGFPLPGYVTVSFGYSGIIFACHFLMEDANYSRDESFLNFLEGNNQ
jgi:hypothetical protein